MTYQFPVTTSPPTSTHPVLSSHKLYQSTSPASPHQPLKKEAYQRTHPSLLLCNKYIDKYPTTVIDSGASHHFADETFDGGQHKTTDDGMKVKIADNTIICSTGSNKFTFSNVQTNARICNKFPKLANHLISIG